jgi:hypothetical protein
VLISLWLPKGILFLEDSADPHKAAITNQKLADLLFEILKTQPVHLIWALQTTTSFLASL